jgi:ferritin-like metal-binding protein YciE
MFCGTRRFHRAGATLFVFLNGSRPMQIADFREMYLAELQELVSVEEQLAGCLLRMTRAAANQELKRDLMRHREQTLIQKERLQSILQKHGADRQAHTDQAMQALIAETDKMIEILTGDELRDAGLIASAQKLEHYEIAAYGTASALAGELNLGDDQRILRGSLEEEKAADAKLTELAKRKVNADALAA